MTDWKRRLLGLIALLLAFSVDGAWAADGAGTITRFRGAAIATRDSQSRPLATGAAIFVGDKISTAKNTRLEMSMTDRTVITLGDHSFLVIDEFVFEPGKQGNAALELIKGVFLAASGAIAGIEGGSLTVTTPLATIGIRGTKFWGEQNTDLLEVALLDGKGVFIENAAGRVDLVQVGAATSVAPGQAPAPPEFWDAARIDTARRTVSFE